MIINNVMTLIPQDFRVAVKAAYEEDDLYVVELNEGWENSGMIKGKTVSTIKVHKIPEDEYDTLEYQMYNCTALEKAEHCPVCGERMGVRVEQNDSGLYRIGCCHCHIWYEYMFTTEEQAFAKWRVRQNSYDWDNSNSYLTYKKYLDNNGLSE